MCGRMCICAQPHNPDVETVQCEACEELFHPPCVGLMQAQVEHGAHFMCPRCAQQVRRLPGPGLGLDLGRSCIEAQARRRPAQAGLILM